MAFIACLVVTTLFSITVLYNTTLVGLELQKKGRFGAFMGYLTGIFAVLAMYTIMSQQARSVVSDFEGELQWRIDEHIIQKYPQDFALRFYLHKLHLARELDSVYRVMDFPNDLFPENTWSHS